MKHHPTSRRTFLGGAAAAIGLPFLPSLARAGGSTPPLRLLFWYVPNGMRMERFVPIDTGPAWTLSEMLTPLAAHRSKLLVLSNVSNSPGADSVPGDHARGTAAFLTARRASRPDDPVALGPSADHLASRAPAALGRRLASLHLSTDPGPGSGTCDSDYPCAFQNTITWADATTPIAPRTDPRAVFEVLFGGFDPAVSEAARQRRLARRSSVLDHVTAEANDLSTRLSTDDRARLDQYLTGVRELEQRVATEQAGSAPACATGAAPVPAAAYPDLLDQLTDLMVKAVECDATRVLSMIADRSGSYRSFAFMGVPEAHHSMSHWNFSAPEAPHRLAQWQAIGTWHVARFGDLLTRLDAVTEADGSTLLDNCLAYFGSEIGDGNSHDHHDVPALLAGGGRGTVDTGRHLRFASREPVANLFLGMLDRFGAPQPTFGDDGTRVMPGVFL